MTRAGMGFSPARMLKTAGLCALLLFGAEVPAQRDPTMPPATALAPAASAAARSREALDAPLAVIVREGRPYVVVGTRLVAQGQMLGDARIERITETEIWLREGKQLRKVARYAGIQRTVLP